MVPLDLTHGVLMKSRRPIVAYKYQESRRKIRRDTVSRKSGIAGVGGMTVQALVQVIVSGLT